MKSTWPKALVVSILSGLVSYLLIAQQAVSPILPQQPGPVPGAIPVPTAQGQAVAGITPQAPQQISPVPPAQIPGQQVPIRGQQAPGIVPGTTPIQVIPPSVPPQAGMPPTVPPPAVTPPGGAPIQIVPPSTQPPQLPPSQPFAPLPGLIPPGAPPTTPAQPPFVLPMRPPAASQPQVPTPAPQQVSPPPPFQEGTLDMEEIQLTGARGFKKGGNYVKKRQALRKAQDGFEELRRLVESLELLRNQFIQRRQLTDKKVDQFYIEIGFKGGNVEQEINQTIQELAEERVRMGELDEQERELLDQVTRQKEMLEQLKKDIDSIRQLNMSLDTAIKLIAEQLSKAHQYEDKAWKNYQTIDELLDHVEATYLANEINEGPYSFVANVKKIQGWLQGSLANFFSQTSQTIDKQMGTIRATINNLAQEGIVLQTQAQKLKAEDERRKAQEEEARRKLAEEQKKKAYVPTFAERVRSTLAQWWTNFMQVFRKR